MRTAWILLVGIIILFNNANAQHSSLRIRSLSQLNSYANEQNPVMDATGKVIYLIRAHHANDIGGRADKGDIWIAEYNDSTGWSKPRNAGYVINNKYHNGLIGIAGRNKYYLYNLYPAFGKSPTSRGISVTIFEGNSWKKPVSIDIDYFFNRSDNRGISIAKNGKVMILSLESFKTIGGEDIYVSFWQQAKQKWTEPKNLGPVVNTGLQELTPFLADDNETLFFSSNGHGGFGSRDIFMSKRLDNTWTNWSTPVNLGGEINSAGAEMYFKLYQDLGFAVFTSTTDSNGYGDIRIVPYSSDSLSLLETTELLVQPEIVEINTIDSSYYVSLVGKISDASTGEPVAARVLIKDDAGFQQEHFNDYQFSFNLPSVNGYSLQIEAEGYVSKNVRLELSTNELKTLTQDIKLDPIKIGTIVKLDNVLFERGATKILEASYDELNLVAQMMKDNPSMEIELAGHTDNVGNPKLNFQLSQQRVEAVIDYLNQAGIESSRLSGQGYGGSKPIASNASENTRKLNRRVAFTILKR